MERRSFERIANALDAAGVRYLVCGGLAVVAHGHVRFTADVDLALDMAPDNLRAAIRALEGLGYVPRAPVPFASFADPDARAAWMRDKQLAVFSLHSPEHPATEVDLFVDPPLDVPAALRRAVRMEIAPGVEVPFAGLEDLLAMKRSAGRPVDLEDVSRLEALRGGPSR